MPPPKLNEKFKLNAGKSRKEAPPERQQRHVQAVRTRDRMRTHQPPSPPETRNHAPSPHYHDAPAANSEPQRAPSSTPTLAVDAQP